MGNLWIRFGCFLTGHNYRIVRNSSEMTAKAVKRYTSAILIVCILWAFVGFFFTNRYLDGGLFGSLAGSLIAVIIIVQIERQIILTMNPSGWLYFARITIALLMAIIGAVIIDQVIFQKDIELEKINFIQNRVDNALPPKTAELRKQIATLDTAIIKKENERLLLIADITKNPTIRTVASSTKQTPITETVTDSTGKTTIKEVLKNAKTVEVTSVPNPKLGMISPLEENIKNLQEQKSKKETALIHAREELEADISSRVGFLDELEVMHTLITRSYVALGVWFVWCLFIIFLELLVLFSKIGDKKSDYEKTVTHHMELQIRKLDALARAANVN